MNELEGKRPATIVDTRQVTITAAYHQKAALAREVMKQAQRGRIRPIDPRPTWNQQSFSWEQRVIQLRPEPPAWRGALLFLAALLFGCVVILALAWWVLASLAALPLGALCVAAVVALAVALRAGRSPSVTVISSTTVKIRR